MVERGELASADGVYELAGRVRRRQPAQDWSLAPELRAWDGEWLMGVVASGARPADDRSALRDSVRRLRMRSCARACGRVRQSPAECGAGRRMEGRRLAVRVWGAGPTPIRSRSPTGCSVGTRGRRALALLTRRLEDIDGRARSRARRSDRRCVRCRRGGARARALRSTASARVVRFRLARRSVACRVPRVPGGLRATARQWFRER